MFILGSTNSEEILKYTCHICKENFATENDVKLHQTSHYVCIHCQKTFSSKNVTHNMLINE